jgi:hypothetical protein
VAGVVFAAHPSRLGHRRKCAAGLAPQDDVVSVAVILRCRSVAKASKDDGVPKI